MAVEGTLCPERGTPYAKGKVSFELLERLTQEASKKPARTPSACSIICVASDGCDTLPAMLQLDIANIQIGAQARSKEEAIQLVAGLLVST